MRLKERGLVTVTICPRAASVGAMGGRARTFGTGVSVRASVLPDGGDVKSTGRGDADVGHIVLLVPIGTAASAGDRATVGGRHYIIRAADAYRTHKELVCEHMS